MIMRYKKKKHFFLSIFSIFSFLFFTTACSGPDQASNTNEGKPSVIRMDGSFTVNMDNPQETVGDADYVFLARVNQKVNTVYKDPVTIETESGTKEISTPYTNYEVTVLKNIKGSLQLDTNIPIQKAGGNDKDDSSIVLYEDDNLPEVGKAYVFLAYAQDDGSLLVSGPHSNTFVKNINKAITSKKIPDDIEKSEVISKYKNANKNQVVRDRDRSISKYDTKK